MDNCHAENLLKRPNRSEMQTIVIQENSVAIVLRFANGLTIKGKTSEKNAWQKLQEEEVQKCGLEVTAIHHQWCGK